MKLIDFRDFAAFNKLREAMGAKLIDFSPPPSSFSPPDAEILKLLETGGIEINDLEEIIIEQDQTLSYKNKRIILYIQDCAIYREGQAYDNPRFHIAGCSTYQTMCKQGREKRYVISSRNDGFFNLNHIDGNKIIKSGLEKLEVCSNCLDKLGWMGYKSKLPNEEKAEIKARFTLEKFFKCYPKDLLDKAGHYYDALAPENRYPKNWSSTSKRTRESKNFTCENCGINLKNNPRYLDVHHINGIKSDDSNTNLKVLCVKCHSNEPMHAHMKNDPRLKDFLRDYPES